MLYNSQVVIVGDLNLRLEDSGLPAAADFRAIEEQFGLIRPVAEPTHQHGGWLDVIITRDDCVLVDLHISPPTTSDHGLVVPNVPFLRDALDIITKLVRGWRDLDREAFRAALAGLQSVNDPSSLADLSVAEAFSAYEKAMTGFIDQFLPQRTPRIWRCPLSPWFDGECRFLRRQACHHERTYRRTGLPSVRLTWEQFVRNMHSQYREKERTNMETWIASHAGDRKGLWASFDTVLGRGRRWDSHSSCDRSFTADDFSATYATKISNARKATEGFPAPRYPHRLSFVQVEHSHH